MLIVGAGLSGIGAAHHLQEAFPGRSYAILEAREEGDFWTFRFTLGDEWARYVIEKGSIALDGISLTVARLRRDDFEVAVIPETLRRTTLGAKSAGAAVNVEVDLLGKYVERILAAWREGSGRDERLRTLLAG